MFEREEISDVSVSEVIVSRVEVMLLTSRVLRLCIAAVTVGKHTGR